METTETLKNKLAQLDADTASQELMRAIFTDELTATIDKIIQPVIDEFRKAHPFVSLGWELKMDIVDSSSKGFVTKYGSMKGHRKVTKRLRDYRRAIERAIASNTKI